VGADELTFLLAHLSDPHIGGVWADVDPAAGLAAAVDTVLAVQPPDAVLVSGDLADNAADDEYEQVRELLAPLGAPVYVLPGNHDDVDVMARHFGARAPYSVDLGPLRLVVLDTTLPGEDAGSLGAGQLEWLDAELAAAPDRLTLVAMHHPPVLTGIAVWDAIGLPPAHRIALAAVIARHPQVRRLVGGHVHRTITGDLAGRPVLTVPSTYVQGKLDFDAQAIELTDEPAGFALHAVVDGELISHLQPVR
jgi:3',5'-cyclic AMP phosphodiesterase CpdA